jgi:flagellar biosynthesis protein FlhB
VLAKGRNLLAEEIKAEARWAGVPIIENPPLARSLYRSVEVGQRFRSISTPPWPRFWPGSIASAWRPRCASAALASPAARAQAQAGSAPAPGRPPLMGGSQ